MGMSSLPWRWLLHRGVCPRSQGISVPHLEGREQEVIPATRVVGVHHIPGQVDLGSQVLDSGKPPAVRGRRGPPGTGPEQLGEAQAWEAGHLGQVPLCSDTHGTRVAPWDPLLSVPQCARWH